MGTCVNWSVTCWSAVHYIVITRIMIRWWWQSTQGSNHCINCPRVLHAQNTRKMLWWSPREKAFHPGNTYNLIWYHYKLIYTSGFVAYMVAWVSRSGNVLQRLVVVCKAAVCVYIYGTHKRNSILARATSLHIGSSSKHVDSAATRLSLFRLGLSQLDTLWSIAVSDCPV